MGVLFGAVFHLNIVFPTRPWSEGLPAGVYGYGDSYLLNPNGEIAAGCGLNEECLMTYDLDMNRKFRSNKARNRRSAERLGGILKETLERWQ